MANRNKPIVIDLSYFYAEEEHSYENLMQHYASSSGQHALLVEDVDLHVIRCLNQEKEICMDKVQYHFFKGKTSKFWMPFRLHRFMRSLNPDIILIHGFLNPLQVLLLTLQTKAKLVIQYHGGPVPKGFKGLLQKLLKFRVRHYIFTAVAQAHEFKTKGFIQQGSTIYDIVEGSTLKTPMPKQLARELLGIPQNKILYLWVGRLDTNKDPLTVLNGMERIFEKHPESILLMIYGEEQLYPELSTRIKKSPLLFPRVHMLGKKPHHELDNYYSSADFFVLGSHHEGSGYALTEAMACGCVPVVTAIPSFVRMTNEGKIGSLWEPGNAESFVTAVEQALAIDFEKESQKTQHFFEKELSFAAIAAEQLRMFREILKQTY